MTDAAGRLVGLPPIPRPEDAGRSFRYRAVMVGGLFAVTAYLVVFNRILSSNPYDIWGGYFLAPILFAIGAPILLRMLRAVEPDTVIHRLALVALIAKLVGGFVRYYTNEHVLGHGDARLYWTHGTAVANEFRSFIFGGPEFQASITDFTGTRFIRLVTSLVYTVSGSTYLGGYVIFSFFSFWGLYLFYRAYCIAMPDGLRRRYAVLIFFLPSVVFWPSSIGKEAWMTTMLGIGSYGLARLLTQQRGAYLTISGALAGMGLVRPHVAALFGVSLVSAFILRRTKGGGGSSRKIVGLIVFAAMAGVLLNQLQSFFNIESTLDAQQVLDETGRRSGQGGSQFDSARPTSPAQLPWAIVTVLFRPFLFEAGSAAGLVTAIEGTILLGLFIWNLPRLIRLPSLVLKRPYVGYSLLYTIAFAVAFSAISNFGILARQRTQLFPIVAILLTVPYEKSLLTRRDLQRVWSYDAHAKLSGSAEGADDPSDPPPEPESPLTVGAGSLAEEPTPADAGVHPGRSP